MFGCGAEGSVSLLALVEVGVVSEPEPGQSEHDPVVVHITACRPHSLRVRRWLRERMHPEDEIEVYGTDYLIAGWAAVERTLGDVPVLRMAHAV